MSAKRILLVEDDADVREACVDVLQSLGHTVVAVDDGAAALEEIVRQRPDVILLDLIMPMARVDGVTLLSRLGNGAKIPIVILSALGDAVAEWVSPDLRAGLSIAAVLNKPCSFDELADTIEGLGEPT